MNMSGPSLGLFGRCFLVLAPLAILTLPPDAQAGTPAAAGAQAAVETSPEEVLARREEPGPQEAKPGQAPEIASPPEQDQALAEPGLAPANAALKAAIEVFAGASDNRAFAKSQRNLREAIAAFYLARDFAPLWFTGGEPNPEVAPVLAQLEKAHEDGLDLSEFPLPAIEPSNPEKIGLADLALTEAVVAYGRQASGSRVDPRTISPLIGAQPEVAEPALILANVANAGAEAGTVLQAYNPQHPAYVALRKKLNELPRRVPTAHAPKIPAGPALRVGMRDPRVPLIRSRLSLDGDGSDHDESLYDTKIAAAVKDFQKANGLPPSGVLTARTIAALSGGPASSLAAEILANMERWRWMPRDLGESRIEVNIPAFEAVVVEDGKVVQRHRVIVGKEKTPTPIFSNTMQYLIVNPYWNVPHSILRNELSFDPNHLRRLGYQVSSRDGRLIVRQPPGEKNALGLIKFMFPNEYSVYMHDTPNRTLFAESRRAFSHGCVRLDEPFRFAETVLGKGWSEARLKKLVGGKERYINLPKPLPVHIGYFTAFVDENGTLQTREDLYGYSRKLRAALGLEKLK
jgi:murein L,D-transpeptidase YcbB/YkuD